MSVNKPEAVRFANEKIRTVADTLARAYREAKIVLAYWDAKGMDKQFPAGGGAVQDGSDTDGRTPITADDVRALVAVCQGQVTFAESNGGVVVNQILKIAVNP